LPGVLLVLDVYPLRQLGSGDGSRIGASRRHIWLEKLPYVALSVIFGLLAMAAKRSDRTLVDVDETGIMGRLALACHSAWFYLIKTLWPTDLHAFPMRPQPLDWTQAPYILSMLGLIVVSVSLYRCRRHYPGWLVTWLAYLLLLSPMSGLVTYGRQAIGDRYSYLAMTPWVVLTAGGLCQWCAQANLPIGRQGPRRTTCLALGLVWVTILIVLTWRQCQTWENSGTLWTHAIRHRGAEIADLHNNLGVWRARDGDSDAAVVELKQAVWLRPDCRESHVNLANALSQKGDLDKAIATLRIAAWRWPDHIYIRGLLGKALFQAGCYTEAADQYATIAQLRPEESFTHLFLGHVLARGGRYAEAADQYAEALRLDPEHQEARRAWNNVRRLETISVAVHRCSNAFVM
jgi:protein O-mannosyl-transferase